MWYYLLEGNQKGPINEAALEALVAQGMVNAGTYVWREGQADWAPLGTVRLAPTSALAQGVAAKCEICLHPVGEENLIELAGTKVCGACKPVALQKIQEGVPLGGGTVWREGKNVVALDGTTFPPRCVKCNGLASPKPFNARLFWHHPALFLLVFAGFLFYLIAALVVRKRATVEVYLCAQHWQRRRVATGAVWILLIAGLVTFFGGLTSGSAWALLGAGLILVSIFVSLAGVRVVAARRIKDRTVWLRGAGAGFLASLPPWKGI